MANLLSIAELAWRQVFPNPSTRTATKLAEFIATAKLEYAWNLWRISKEDKRNDGDWEVPSSLLRRSKITVIEDEADISHLAIFRGFDGDVWIQNLGGIGCECNYTRQSVNLSRILCDDDYTGNSRPYIVMGNIIDFPYGTHRKELDIIYATNGEDMEDTIEVDDNIGGLVRNRLVEIYSNKQMADKTNNDNPNT